MVTAREWLQVRRGRNGRSRLGVPGVARPAIGDGSSSGWMSAIEVRDLL